MKNLSFLLLFVLAAGAGHAQTNRFYYPDASVVCRPNPQTDSFQDDPAVLFEVLSRQTRRIDEGEKPLAAAKRELLEETGYAAKRWKRVLYFFASPGFVAEPMSLFLAEKLTAGVAQPEDDEVIHMEMVPLTTAVKMVINGTICDAKTISGVLWLSQQRRRSRTA